MKKFYFEIDENGEWSEVSIFHGITEEECVILIEKWVKEGLIPVGEKTKGDCEFDGDKWSVSGKVCGSMGDDESEDDWEDFEFVVK